MLGHGFSEFQHCDVVARDALEFARHLEGGEVTQHETTYLAKDGREIYLIFNAKPLSDGEGRIVGTQGTAFDINERKALEQRIGVINDEFERFFTLLPEMTCIASTDGRFLKLNPSWERTLGYPIAELLSTPLAELIHPEDISAMKAEIAKQVNGMATTDFVNRYRHRDGSYRYLQWDATQAKGETLYAIARDVTERLRDEERIRLEEKRDKVVLNLAQFSMGSLQDLIDLALEELVGFSNSEIGYVVKYEEQSQKIILRACSRQAFDGPFTLTAETAYHLSEAGLWGEAIRLSRPTMVNGFDPDKAPDSRLPAGFLQPRRFLGIPFFDAGRLVAVVCVANKISDYTETDVDQLSLLMGRLYRVITRKKTESDLRESHERLRQLSAHMESIREEERLKISREVHDELGQMMTALKFDIASIRASAGLPPDVDRKLQVMDANVSATIRSVQSISAELRPKLLDDLGLVSSIEWHVKDFAKNAGIACRLNCSASLPQVRPECAITIFRIFQEALTNIKRHAGASEVRVELYQQGQEIVLIIADNGKGITNRELFAENSFGIMGMHERATSCFGKLSINGSPGEGTTVRLHIATASPGERSE